MPPPPDLMTATPRLSICIATFKRGAFIAETLESIVDQLDERVELIVVDGASPDDTAAQVRPFLSRGCLVRYIRENSNSGVDADYDKAVAYARGTYCWLMTDDDLLQPNAVARVLAALADDPELLVLNAQIWSANYARLLTPRCMPLRADRECRTEDEAFFVETAHHLSFIGAVVIRREQWLRRDRAAYFGTLFVHIGVLFQSPPLGRAKVIAEPLIRIRYGNAMWTSRGFEIWMFKWPQLIWSFDGYSDEAKGKVWAREPWRSTKKLLLARALGSYSTVEYHKHIRRSGDPFTLLRARCIASLPISIANSLAGAYFLLIGRTALGTLYDLSRSRGTTAITRTAVRVAGVWHR